MSAANGGSDRAQPSGPWRRIEEIVNGGASADELRIHRLHLIAARVWAAQGRTIPAALQVEQRLAAARAMAAPALLEKIRAAYSGPLMLHKGPELAARFPDPLQRPFRDLDLIVDDPAAAQAALLAAGFVEVDDPTRYGSVHHHRCPVAWPGIPLAVEIHRVPHQPRELPPVDVEDLFRRAVPSATGIPGLLAPEPSTHVVLIASHGWRHAPLGRLGDLLDVAAMLAAGDCSRASSRAETWGWGHMWKTVHRTTNALLSDERPTWPLRLWARHLGAPRERTVLERHIADVAAAACAQPPASATASVARTIKNKVFRQDGEAWDERLRRARVVFAHSFTPLSKHDEHAYILFQAPASCADERLPPVMSP